MVAWITKAKLSERILTAIMDSKSWCGESGVEYATF